MAAGPGQPACLSAASCQSVLSPLFSFVVVLHRRKLLREDEETPMTMFFGFMGLLIFSFMGPLLLILW
jgi:hypothetical protein